MSMTINFTIVVQVINFLVAYLIVTKIFLKPALAVIKMENLEKQNLLDLIAQEKENLILKENYKYDQWTKFRSYFKFNAPKSEARKMTNSDISTIEVPKELTQQETNELLANIIVDLKQKVVND